MNPNATGPATHRRCGKPWDLHCPGCKACRPDDTCELACDATEEELVAVFARIDAAEPRS